MYSYSSKRTKNIFTWIHLIKRHQFSKEEEENNNSRRSELSKMGRIGAGKEQ